MSRWSDCFLQFWIPRLAQEPHCYQPQSMWPDTGNGHVAGGCVTVLVQGHVRDADASHSLQSHRYPNTPILSG